MAFINHITVEAIKQARRKRYVAAVFTVYGDESSDTRGVRTFAVAGIIGTQDEWDELKPVWTERTGGKIFHATDCESGYGDYKGIPKDQRHKEYKDLTKILAKTNMKGVGFAVDVAAFKELMPDAVKDAPYYNCFMRVVMTFAEYGYLFGPQQTTKFIFDRNTKIQYNSIYLVEYLSKLSEYPYSSYIDDIGFASDKKEEIQAADLFAHETMKYFDNRLMTVNLPLRKSLKALFNTKRYRCFYSDRTYFESIKKELEYLEQEDSKWREEYQRWLLKHKIVDNNSNKTRYLIYLKSLEKIDLYESASS